jgi:hypothetical protein
MSDEQRVETFDWVTAQSKCSASSMFERLHAGVEQDVLRRNSIFERQDGWSFELHEEDHVFEVSRHVRSGPTRVEVTATVSFELDGRRIHIRGEDIDVDFTAIVTLDTTGTCRFVVGEAMFADWEIRKMALEQLFFEEPDASE